MQNAIVTLREKELDSGFYLWIRYVPDQNYSVWSNWFKSLNAMLDDLIHIIKYDRFFMNHWVSVLTAMQPQIFYQEDMEDAQIAEENMSLLQNQWDTAFKEMYTIMYDILSSENIKDLFSAEILLDTINKAYDICEICLNLPIYHNLSRELNSLYREVRKKIENVQCGKREREEYTSPEKIEYKVKREWKQYPPQTGNAIVLRYFNAQGYGFLHIEPGVKEIYFRKEVCNKQCFKEGDRCSFTIDSNDSTGTKAKRVTLHE